MAENHPVGAEPVTTIGEDGMTPGAVALLLTALVAMSGCVSTPEKPAAHGAVFPKPTEDVQKAAVDALVVLGFEVKKSDPTYVEGYRPRKVGLFVGSGGETVGIWIEPLGASRTGVRVDTARTFAGGAGQKRWDEDVLKELEKSLGKKE
jgi:hypothetical protein